MNRKKVLAFILITAMVLSSFSVAFSVESNAAPTSIFSDINGHWAAPAIEKWAGYGVLKGSDGLFRPDEYITRAEMAALLVRIIDIEATAENTFSDVPSDAWYADAVLKAFSAGILNGDSEGHASPNELVTREQAVVMLARAFSVAAGQEADIKFNDAGLISSWAKPLAAGMETAGYITGFNNLFNPQGNITRAEVITILDNMSDNPLIKKFISGLVPKSEEKPSSSSGGSGGPSGTSTTSYDTLKADGTCLRPFTLLGYIEDDEGLRMNLIDVESDAAYYYAYSANSHTFTKGSRDSVKLVGSFVELWSIDSDDKAELVLSVPRSMSNTYWDADMFWLDGVGESTEPSVDDDTGKAIFSQEYAIPIGERLLTGYGLGDWSGTTDFSNIISYGDETGTTLTNGLNYYWPQHNYYNAESNDTLTMLTGYKTSLQATGGTCGPASALTVLEWYEQRGDLNEEDLSALRTPQPRWGGFTSLEAITGIFDNLGKLGVTAEWDLYSSYDVDYNVDYPEDLYNPGWIQDTLASGSPILVGWNSFGGHWQVIIGYDNMGTAGTADDVLILMDPYDTTDHRNDGYNIQSYERLAYGVTFEDDFYSTVFLVATPEEGWNYDGPVMHDGTGYTISATSSAMSFGAGYGAEIEDNWIDYRDTANDIYNIYPDTYIWGDWDDGLAGPATGSYRHTGDVVNSSYYSHFDIYNIENDVDYPNLILLEEFQTIQQATEWTCGLASALMVIEYFDKNVTDAQNPKGLTEIDLAKMRQNGKAGATTVNGMEEVFDTLNSRYDEDWAWFTMRDLDKWLGIGDHYLESGAADDGLIPYLLSEGIPIMIGWDEWGGHWQVIIGYDDMGTDATQDDVLILADPYDTTDHNMDGYVLESFERLVYGWSARFDEDYAFIVAFPEIGYKEVIEALGLEKPYFTPDSETEEE